jgi:nitroreductase
VEFLEALEQRRAVRAYRREAVDRAAIERVIHAAILAPSAMNLQPWAFAVVTGIERIDDLARRAKDYLVAHPQALGLPEQARMTLTDPQFSMLYHAPVLLIVLAKNDTQQAKEDACLAAQTLMLAAREMALGTCWIGLARPWLELPETRRELGIPAGYAVVAPIVLGHPTAWPASPGRRPAEIFWPTLAAAEVSQVHVAESRRLHPTSRRPLSGDELADAAESFGACDADGDGRIDFAEFSQLLEHLGLEGSSASYRNHFDGVDADRDGFIDRHEFVQWWRGP